MGTRTTITVGETTIKITDPQGSSLSIEFDFPEDGTEVSIKTEHFEAAGETDDLLFLDLPENLEEDLFEKTALLPYKPGVERRKSSFTQAMEAESQR